MSRTDARPRANGYRPGWRYEVDGFQDAIRLYDEDADNVEQARDALVAALKASTWYAAAQEYGELYNAVEELVDAVEAGDVDAALWTIYDLADDERAWLGL